MISAKEARERLNRSILVDDTMRDIEEKIVAKCDEGVCCLNYALHCDLIEEVRRVLVREGYEVSVDRSSAELDMYPQIPQTWNTIRIYWR